MPVRGDPVRSSDGTTLGSWVLGQGPDLVVVHGAMQSAHSQLDLARLLAPHFRVHLMDRRGRGRSGAYPATVGTGVEVDDLLTVLDATDSRRVLGISSGALIAARVALATDRIERLALFEPPLAVAGSVPLERLGDVDDALRRDDLPTAMSVAMRVAEMGPPVFFRMPAPLLRAVSRRSLARDRKRPRSDARPALEALVRALRADFAIVREQADRATDFTAVRADTLLVAGTATRPYLRTAATTLAGAIPHSELVELPGTNHGVTQNHADYGRPERIAPHLLRFFR